MGATSRHIVRTLIAGLAWAFAAGAALADQPVAFKASDGLEVGGTYYGTPGSSRPLVLLFHMASSNRGEYRAIAPRLNQLGFDALAIDQRSGGAGFGARNETAARLGRGATFDEALKDLEAALAWARGQKPARPIIVWGSSYSASLVFLLAASHPGEIAGVLSFSPGEYLNRSGAVREAARKVGVPVFVSSASDSGEISEARAILAAAASPSKTQFVPKSGLHGSSTLDPARNPRGAEENWTAVAAFLDRLKP
jgi:dienelactone hydrolase